MGKKIRAFQFLGIVLLIYILSRIDMKSMVQVLSKTSLHAMLIGTVIALGALVLSGIRWQLIISCVGRRISLKDTLTLWLKGAYLDFFIPAKVGSLYKAKYLADHQNINIGKAGFTVVLERLLDLFSLFILAIVGVFLLIGRYGVDLGEIPLVISFILFTAIIIVVMNKKAVLFFITLARPIIHKFLPEKTREHIKLGFDEFFNSIKMIGSFSSLVIFLLSMIIWFSRVITIYILARGISLSLPFDLIAGMVPIAIILASLPITFLGFGTREAVYIMVLALENIGSEQAVALAFLAFIFTWLIYLIPAFLAHMIQLEGTITDVKKKEKI